MECEKAKSVNEQNRNKLIDTENILTIAKLEEYWGYGWKGEEINK